jgi:Holliday junction resolvasome RuvABC DNA-binding subunit
VVSALINLGFRPQSADQALAQALLQRPDAGFDDLLRSCLALLRRPG